MCNYGTVSTQINVPQIRKYESNSLIYILFHSCMFDVHYVIQYFSCTEHNEAWSKTPIFIYSLEDGKTHFCTQRNKIHNTWWYDTRWNTDTDTDNVIEMDNVCWSRFHQNIADRMQYTAAYCVQLYIVSFDFDCLQVQLIWMLNSLIYVFT